MNLSISCAAILYNLKPSMAIR